MGDSAKDVRNSAPRTSPIRFLRTLAGKTVIEDDSPRERIYRPQGMEGWVLNCTVEGRGEVNRGADQVTCEPGDILLFPEGVAHDYTCASGCPRWVHLWAHYLPRPAWGEWMDWPVVSHGVRAVRVSEQAVWDRVAARMRDIVELVNDPLPYRMDLCINAIEEVLLWVSAAAAGVQGGATDRRVRDSIVYLRRNYAQVLNVDTLARSCALSVSRFAHLFREQTGVSPMRYVERLRVSRAQELLLTTNRAVADIARACGFDNPQYFSHVFRRNSGRSPRSFRQGSLRRRGWT